MGECRHGHRIVQSATKYTLLRTFLCAWLIEIPVMKASTFKSGTAVIFALLGVFFTLLIWISGSHQYGALSRIWQYTGIPSLLGFSFAAHLISVAILRDIKRCRDSSFRLLFVFSLAAVMPFACLLLVLIMRFFYGGD